MAIPTVSEELAKLKEYLVKAQESAAMIGHLHKMQDNRRDNALGNGWLFIAETMRAIQNKVTTLAQGKLN